MQGYLNNLFQRYTAALNHKAVHPSYEYHTARRFNQGAYDQAVAAASAAINQIETEIQATLTNLHNSVQSVTSELSACYAQHKISSSNNNQLNYRIEQDKRQLQDLDTKNNYLQSDLNTASNQTQCYNVRAEQLQRNLQENKDSAVRSRHECQALSAASFNILKSADMQQRAFFLSELWSVKDNKENKNGIEVIKSLGFDANALAHYAIMKRNEELFDLALEYKADCINYMVEGKTLLQKIIHLSNDKFMHKVLTKDTNVCTTIIKAIDNDMLTVNKLLEYNSELTKEKFFGYTLLQIAIDVKNEALVEKILAIDSSSAAILTNNGESALKIAVRSGTDNIVQLVASHVNLETEIEQLDLKVSRKVRAKLLENRDIETVIKLFKGETSLLEQYAAEQPSKDDANQLFGAVPSLNTDNALETFNSNFASISLLSSHEHQLHKTELIDRDDNPIG